MDLSKVNVLVAVFAMHDCPACEAYTPRLAAAARAYGRPFHVHDGVQLIPRGSIPIIFYDVSQPDPEIASFADRYQVTATPTTLVLVRGPGTLKVEGNLSDDQITHVLQSAHAALRR